MKNEHINTQADFLSLFSGTRFRYIHEVTKEIHNGDDKLDPQWNSLGYGVFFTVNGFPPTGEATIERIRSLNCNFVDIDIEKGSMSQSERDLVLKERLMKAVEDGLPVPGMIVRTKNGAHLYWMYDKPLFSPNEQQMKMWRGVQDHLVLYFDGDKNAKDPARILRVPFTKHLKDPNDPFEVIVQMYKPDNVYTLDQLNKEIPQINPKQNNYNQPVALEILMNGVPIGKGLRHDAMAKVAGLLLRNVNTQEEVNVARQALYDWDQKIVGSPEPLYQRRKEINDTIDGILKKELGSRSLDKNLKPTVWTIGDILNYDFGEEQWIAEFLIPKQGMTALSGNPGDFKTWLTIHIAQCVSRGEPVFKKYKTEKGGVLVIDEEDNLRLIKKRLSSLGITEADNIHYISQSGIKVDSEEGMKIILEVVEKKNIKLLVLDSLVRVHGRDENDAGSMAGVFKSLQKVLILGASILFTHHHRKQFGFNTNLGQSMRGSSDILAAVDCHITVEKKKDVPGYLIIRQSKLRQAEIIANFEVSIIHGETGPSGFEYVGVHDDQKQKVDEALEAIPLLLAQGMQNRESLIETLKEEKIGKTAIEAGIKLAESKGIIERVPRDELEKKEQRKAYYRIPITSKVVEELPDFLPI